MTGPFVTVLEADRDRLSRYVNDRLKLPMIAYEIAREGRIYEWHLELNVDGMDEMRQVCDHVLREHPVADWLDAKKAAL